MDGQIATVTENNCIRILAIAVVTHSTLAILFFSLGRRLAVHGR